VNGEGRGFFRTRHAAPLLAKLRAGWSDLAPEERLTCVSDQWALVRAGKADIETYLDLVCGIGCDPDHAVADEVARRLQTIEDRFTPEQDRCHMRAEILRVFGAAGRFVRDADGFKPEPDQEASLWRAAVFFALALVARERDAVAAAERLFVSGGLTAACVDLDPNLLDVVVATAARGAGHAQWLALRERAVRETDPTVRRRCLHALARTESAPLMTAAVELALSEAVPMQDFTQYLARLLNNRLVRDEALRMVVTEWQAVCRKADSPLLARHLVGVLTSLPERGHLEQVERLFAEHPIAVAAAATAQGIGRMQVEIAASERLTPQVSAWLRRRIDHAERTSAPQSM
jgi:puromycin-sensitive aminopeptidase